MKLYESGSFRVSTPANSAMFTIYGGYTNEVQVFAELMVGETLVKYNLMMTPLQLAEAIRDWAEKQKAKETKEAVNG